MAYQIVLDPNSKAIRRADNLHLRLQLKRGSVDAYLLRKAFHVGFGCLIGIPFTDNNLAVLGVENTSLVTQWSDLGQEWIIPPFTLQNSFFGKGGPFVRIGKLDPTAYVFDPEATAILAEVEDYSPYLLDFVPRRKLQSITLGIRPNELDRTDWRIKMHESKAAVREPTQSERNLPLVPWTVFGLGDPDLWLEQFRCLCLGQPIPSVVKGADDS
ncbi:hypothetical protein [Corynebacterium auriscanis]|uniref:Uncharacterized protein n=1 Tax=Corynebacterium auriscanis TaxID=99807 RepID=A0A0A2DNI0_9CORY|nr:hypothetical protein [Corynebacterium auriscanis]KGM18426.1 hypothetical protein MA47_07435 [Corynebacterium auriscanis]WJY71761.1 hypothetical protein CAURIC_00385 [Corynebacterium auriscanis]